MSENDDELVYSNGVDATSGGYLVPPMSLAEIAAMARGENEKRTPPGGCTQAGGGAGEGSSRAGRDLDKLDLAEAGWGLVVAGTRIRR